MAVGERIEEKPMVRIAVVDPLRVQVVGAIVRCTAACS